jgi:hypothetical protein
MAPEVYTGTAYSPMADIYSGTMTAHFLVTGELAFDRMPPPLIAERAALKGARPGMQLIQKKYCELADDLVPLFEAGWAASPEDRPTAQEMRDKLQFLRARAIDAASKKSKTLKGQVKGLFNSIKKSLSSQNDSSVQSHPPTPAQAKLFSRHFAASMGRPASDKPDKSDAGGASPSFSQENGQIWTRTRSDEGEDERGSRGLPQMPSRCRTLTI